MTVLVVAASRHGATAGIADAIAEGLERRGVSARSLAPGEEAGLEDYDAVVLGSAVYAGHWLEEAKAFVEQHAVALKERPVWLFSSGPLGEPGNLKPEEPPVDAAPMIDVTGARAHEIFAGKLDKAKLKFTEKAIMAAVRAPQGDFRDWEAIDAWAGEIAAAVRGGAPAATPPPGP